MWRYLSLNYATEQQSDIIDLNQGLPEQNPASTKSPFDLIDPATDSEDSSKERHKGANQKLAENSSSESISYIQPRSDVNLLQAYELGVVSLTEEQKSEVVFLLKQDSALMQAVVDEFRAETDPKRLQYLSSLLGDTEDSSLVIVASDMVYSGNSESQLAALDLLRRLQPFAPEARDVVLNLLTTEADPLLLKETLNILAMPGDATAIEREELVRHILPLTTSKSPIVRQRSISTISNWSAGDVVADVLLVGLKDTHESVRKTAAYSTVNLKNPSPELLEALFSVLENQNELPRARKGARLSLQRKNLSQSDTQRLQTAVAQMRKQYSNKP